MIEKLAELRRIVEKNVPWTIQGGFTEVFLWFFLFRVVTLEISFVFKSDSKTDNAITNPIYF
jgi:hypothetical protein